MEKGARLLLLGDDSTGQGRRLYVSLRRQMQGKGLRVVDISPRGRTDGRDVFGLQRSQPAPAAGSEELDFQGHRERLLDSLRRGLDGLHSDEPHPIVLFVEDLERCDDHTKLLLEMLLDSAAEDYPFREDPDMRAVVVALDGRGPTAETLARHPATLRFDPGPASIARRAQRRKLRVEAIRAIRLLQLSELPLRAAEVNHIAGRGALESLRKEDIALECQGRGKAARYRIVDPSPAGLPEPGSLPEAELRRYHQRLLEVFESRPDDANSAVARLRHAVGAGQPQSVVRHAGPALDTLLEALRRAEARDLIAGSLETLAGHREHAGEAIRLRRRLARLDATAGRPLDAATSIQAIPRSSRSADDELLLARSLLGAGRPHEVHEAIGEVICGAPAGRNRPEVLRLKGVLAEAEYVRANLDEAAGLCRDLASASNLPAEDKARVRNTLGKVYLARGKYQEAERIFRDNLSKAKREGLDRHALIAKINAGVARIRLLHYSSAKKLLVEALGVAVEKGFYREEAIARENLATVHHMLRDYGEAMEHYRGAFALLRYLGNPEYLARIANNLGEIYIRFGDVDRASATRSFALRMGAEHPVSRVEAEGLLLEGRIHLMQGNSGQASSSFEQAARVFAGLDDTPHRVEALIWQAAACTELRQLGRAQSLLGEARPLACGDQRTEARLNLEQGRLERLRGREAGPLLTEALELLRRSSDLEGELEALHALAESELDRGDTIFARQHLEQASEINAAIRARVPEAFHESFDSTLVRRRLATTELRARALEREGAGTDRTKTKGGACQPPFPKIVGQSEPMQVVYRAVKRVAKLEDLVLIEGESGTGKELVAEAIHDQSKRADKPLIKINCASFVENLLQSELFGHERGAFTGAVRRRRGWFETASGGTLFLDEIGDIPPSTQVNLLRVLQDKVIYRVGGREPVEVNVRILAATNRNLKQLVADGHYRKDLYYRLQGLRIVMPPLHERREDIRPLVEHILDGICTEFRLQRRRVRFSEGALRLLESLTWPGNVRELENSVRSAVLFADGRTVTQRDLSPYIEPAAGTCTHRTAAHDLQAASQEEQASGETVDLNQVLLGAVSLPQFKKEIERRCIVEALRAAKGNITKAADLLGMKRPRLSQLVKYYGISKSGASPIEES
ncbi:MAG: sigma 54-interacting transcriptional regulator [Deltaproteobacteria bacterium]|nr:sigma 54-interacting transcriptional regulator [Deltaproteobacteria bacterium]